VFWSGARLVGTKTVELPNQFYEDFLRRQRQQPWGPSSCSTTTGVDIERWQRGDYEVDIVVDKRLVATGTFRMDEKDRIYDEVRAKAADRSAARGFITQLDAKVTALRFYEGDATASRAQRSYRTQFSQATTRDVNWELDLSHPPPHRWLPFTIEALLFYRDAAGERVVQRKVLQSAAPADWSDTHHTDFFGWEDDYYFYRSGATTRSPGRWMPGIYRVDLHVANTKVATGSFELR